MTTFDPALSESVSAGQKPTGGGGLHLLMDNSITEGKVYMASHFTSSKKGFLITMRERKSI